MIKQSLNGQWKFKNSNNKEWLNTTVPGTVYGALLLNNKMDDPYFRDNEIKATELMEDDYEYSFNFKLDSDILSCEKVILSCKGIDTIAEIYINENLIGTAYNMHRLWEYEVKKNLKQGDNSIHIILKSPIVAAREAFKKCRTLGSEDTMDGFVHIRKAHCMYGWDWGAHLPDSGIFRDIEIIGIDKGRIDSVYIEQSHIEGTVSLKINTEVENLCENFKTEITIIDYDGNIIVDKSNLCEFEIKNPKLWWPNGLGEQPLYKVLVSLVIDDKIVDINENRIGLRVLSVKREKDEYGECFEQVANGISYFAMGANYIPEDHLISRTSKERTRALLVDCKAANFNVIRVWGGGYYPEDWFFDICDELGLVVWQDFMFACAVYELTEEFEENIVEEFIYNIKRIRNHASIGIWCGNNEMEQFVAEKHHWVSKHTEVRDYLLMYERILPKLLKKYDPNTFYWPASPSSGGSFDDPNDHNRGDVHYWEVWHRNRPFSEYRKYFFRYASEFGFQSFPCKKTIEMITDKEEEMNPFSYIMEKHQRNYGANGKIMNYMQQTFLYPSNFDNFVFASQLLQAEAIKYGIEHFRRNRERCMGAIYWQLNDCWPVVSWASIDYSGRWKALHYYAKRFFAGVMISCHEESMMTQEADMNREHFNFEKSIRLNVANETQKPVTGVVFWELRDGKSNIIREEKIDVTVEPMSVKWLDKEIFDDIDTFNTYVSYHFEVLENIVSSGSVIFTYPKYFKYENPLFTYKIDGNDIIIKSEAYAKSVEIQNENEDLILSDNYFDMNKGERKVTVIRGNIDNIKIRSVYDIK